MVSPVILILGGGLNTGVKVAQKFAQNGFKIALVTRTTSTHQDNNTRDLIIKNDFTDPASIKSIFDEVKAKIGVPNVVLYNAYTAKYSPDPLSFTVEDFASRLGVNTVNVYAAAKEAVAGFDTLPTEAIKAFIYTGNRLNIEVMPELLDLGVGKAASAYLIESWAKTYTQKGYNFYYGDERNADGSPVGGKISGENHAKFYYELALKKEQGPWDATFVGGKGYVNFSA